MKKLPAHHQPPEWIDTPARLSRLVEELTETSIIAVDTESDSLYSYFEKVCLIQFSTPTHDYLVDPLAVDVSGLGPIFAEKTIQKVFHAAEYDFLSLKRDYGFSFANLFDTMLAARILGWKRYGLGSLLEKQFDVTLDKRFQRYNWGKRPLSKKALNYAHLDTHYLIPLRESLLRELTRQHRLQEAQEAFERITRVEPTPKVFDPDDFWRIKHAKDLKPRQQAVLRQLFILRDKLARHLDRPPFKVMNASTMVELAKIQPQSRADLKQVKGIGKKLFIYNADDILQAIKAGQTAPPPKYLAPNHNRPDDNTLDRYETLRQWRNGLAAQRGVEPDVIISNHALMSIARSNPKTLKKLAQIEELGHWQRETYGKVLLSILNNKA